jgi:hypothetical protein
MYAIQRHVSWRVLRPAREFRPETCCAQGSEYLNLESTKRLNTAHNSALINKHCAETIVRAADMTLHSGEPCMSRFSLFRRAKTRVSQRVVKTAPRSAAYINVTSGTGVPAWSWRRIPVYVHDTSAAISALSGQKQCNRAQGRCSIFLRK